MTMSVTSLVLSMLLIMGMFYGGFAFIQDNYETAGIEDEIQYAGSLEELETAEDDLKEKVDGIKDSAEGITEAQGNIVLVAWNGLTGLASTIRLFFGLIGVGVSVWNAIFPPLAFLPNFVKVLMEIAILITVVLVIIGAFKGETKT